MQHDKRQVQSVQNYGFSIGKYENLWPLVAVVVDVDVLIAKVICL